jgi:threonine aldolase
VPSPRFASDNVAPAHPAVLAALTACNVGPAAPYGDDPWTARAVAAVRSALRAPQAAVWPVLGGTGANILALRAVTGRVDSVLCAVSSHLVGAETGAPEVVAQVPLVPIAVDEAGRVTPEAVITAFPPRLGDHRPRPRVLSVSNATERGGLYTPEALRALADLAHERGMLLHVDGARLANAATAQDVDLGALTTDVGVDLVSLGGTKAGLMGAEAVVFLDPSLAPDAGRHRKQITQLASKMRFVSAQLLALLEDDLWRTLGGQANAMARRLADALAEVPGVRIVAPVETNALFVALPPAAIASLREDWAFELWDPARGVVRLMTAWDVTPEEVGLLAADVAEAVRKGAAAPGLP